jgi:hypothetical protein
MNPWTIIGWILVAAAAVSVMLPLATALYMWAALRIRRWKDRRHALRTPPQGGQVWEQDGTLLAIDKVTDSGMILIATASGMVGWGETLEEWQQRVRCHHVKFLRQTREVGQ